MPGACPTRRSDCRPGCCRQGCPAVIGTLWSVDDLSTTLLMSRFYAYHRHGDPATGEGPLSPAAALRRAQAWLRTVTADELVDSSCR